MRKTRQMMAFEARHGKPIEELITEALNRHNGSVAAAAESMNLNMKTLWGWMLRLRVRVTKTATIAT